MYWFVTRVFNYYYPLITLFDRLSYFPLTKPAASFPLHEYFDINLTHIFPMIKTYRSPKTITKTSNKGGKGLFAGEDLLADEIIAIRAGHIVDTEKAKKLDMEIGDFSLQVSDEFYICPESREEIEDIALFINHSCDPNIGMDGQICFVAMRNIQAGEELCLDYAMALTGYYRMNCNCGSSICRKVITGDDWKKEELQKRYAKYFFWFLYKKINSF